MTQQPDHESASNPRWQRRKEARPTEIVEAALKLFVERGFAATKLDEVARAAGVTKGTLYLYFDSKEALFKAVVQETLLPNITSAEHVVADYQGDAASLLLHLLTIWAERLATTPTGGISKLMVAEAANFPELARFYYDEVVVRSTRLFTAVIERGIAEGTFRPVDAYLAAREISAPIVMASTWAHAFGPLGCEGVEIRSFARFHFDVLMNGIRQ
ncbi:TetR/AcrR family transcriptional regulator [Parachitinimonas caeni]|uniref:TetR/AcrR family transcriptional regulator n=1 Tax=Parachitinimonas caeni TaxID=3031301 RepID=A0ABT7DX09_9NEIS|nr:TetR/AcrR family transcriptional regulator [Parachitinimonas caeni]MDK2124605.1 TetR/AcrR family transcriptional regulator [Parachitinimonas caeni]